MFKRFLSVVLAALIGAATPAIPAQAPSPAIGRGLSVSAPVALPQLAQRLPDTIPPLYMLGGDDSSSLVASFNAATDPFPSAILSYSGPSLSTMFDSTGKLTYKPNNLLTQSNTFTDAAWSKSNVTVTAGVADPIGGTAASTLTATAANGFIARFSNLGVQNGTNIAVAVWIRRRTGSGTINFARADSAIWQAVTVTSSWTQVYSVYPSNGVNTGNVEVQIVTSGDAIDIYAATASAVTYETTPRTADQVITTASAYYGPRIDYDITGTLKGLFILESRKWDALWNRDFTNAAWVKTNVTAALNQTGIDGVSNSASSLTATAINGTVLQNITLASSARAQSAWIKRLTGSGVISMTIDGGATWTDVTSQIGASYAWVTVPTQTLANPSVGFKFATSGDSIAVDFFGNEGGTLPSPRPIPVANAAVTVAADVVWFTGPALTALKASTGSVIVQMTDQLQGYGASGGVVLGGNTDYWLDLSGAKMYSQTSAIGIVTVNSTTANQPYRAGLAWAPSSRSLTLNGGAIVSDGNSGWAAQPAYLGSYAGTTNFVSGHVASFAIYNQRLPDATLQAKSVIGASYATNDNGIRYAFADNDNLPIHWRVAL